jgi:hypothetical protein
MTNSRGFSRTAGLLYLIVAITGFFVMNSWNQLIVKEDIPKTISNILSNESLFRISLCSNVIMTLAWMLLSLYLYRIFKEVGNTASLTMVAFVFLGSTLTLFSTFTKNLTLKIISTNEFSAFLYS